MRNLTFATIALLGLAACAQMQVQPPPEERWATYRAEVMAKRDRGEVAPVEAQEMLRAQHRVIYGNDSRMDAYFAYSIRLLRDAEDGKLPMPEAQSLVAAHELEIQTERAGDAKSRAGMRDSQIDPLWQ